LRERERRRDRGKEETEGHLWIKEKRNRRKNEGAKIARVNYRSWREIERE
jgi:hypothetical protein